MLLGLILSLHQRFFLFPFSGHQVTLSTRSLVFAHPEIIRFIDHLAYLKKSLLNYFVLILTHRPIDLASHLLPQISFRRFIPSTICHLCLFPRSLKMLISGNRVIKRISTCRFSTETCSVLFSWLSFIGHVVWYLGRDNRWIIQSNAYSFVHFGNAWQSLNPLISIASRRCIKFVSLIFEG